MQARGQLEDAKEEEELLYIGPYYSSNGGKVYLEIITNETWTSFAEDSNGMDTYKELSWGETLPYSTTSLIKANCISCIQQEDPTCRNKGNNYDKEEIEASDQCRELYQSTGKCKSALDVTGSAYYPGYGFATNEATCSDIEGIKFTRIDGIVEGKPIASGTAMAWIVFGGMAALCTP